MITISAVVRVARGTLAAGAALALLLGSTSLPVAAQTPPLSDDERAYLLDVAAPLTARLGGYAGQVAQTRAEVDLGRIGLDTAADQLQSVSGAIADDQSHFNEVQPPDRLEPLQELLTQQQNAVLAAIEDIQDKDAYDADIQQYSHLLDQQNAWTNAFRRS